MTIASLDFPQIAATDECVGAGSCDPLGATICTAGVNFSIYSRSAKAVDLVFFEDVNDAYPSRVIPLSAATQRTHLYWHAFVPKVRAGQVYGYRVDGEFNPAQGNRFDADKVLLDPYGRAVAVPQGYDRLAAAAPGDNAAAALKSVVVDPSSYDWEGDGPLHRPSSRTIIYELHVRGFTRHISSGVRRDKRGTYAGLIEKIPYLQDLGITAVELLPVFAFDVQAAPPGRANYWGYSPVSFFAPHPQYSWHQYPLEVLNEFRDMVKALHRAGIEVILDVVYNHTAEDSHVGPTQCLRGIDNSTYYILEPDRSLYSNYSGTGNTLNANHPIVRRMILDSLRYWVQEMHVDGFRFDLASILARDSDGSVLENPPLLWDIESEPCLAGAKMIAEAWDAAGLYQVGHFVGDRWKEWNGRFRDDVRDFFRGAGGSVTGLADRLLGSPAMYGHENREAEQSVNFVTCHDGFTLNDVVSYNQKHNEANNEGNRDGGDDNRSWNCGEEGSSEDPVVEALRNRQVKNMLVVTMMSLGMPMIVMGDEMRRTQGGNNNAYCQDNDISWLDWNLLSKHADVHRFVQLLAARRWMRSTEREDQRVTLNEWIATSRYAWHGVKLLQPDWGPDSHSLAFGAEMPLEGVRVHFILNAFWEPLDFEIPPLDGEKWHRWIDTSLDSPHDIVDWQASPEVPDGTYRAGARSVAMLLTGPGLQAHSHR